MPCRGFVGAISGTPEVWQRILAARPAPFAATAIDSTRSVPMPMNGSAYDATGGRKVRANAQADFGVGAGNDRGLTATPRTLFIGSCR